MSVRGESICSEIEYTFLGIAVATNKTSSQALVDCTAEAKRARSRRRSRALAKRLVRGLFKFPMCCRRPVTSDEQDDEEQEEVTTTELSKHLPYAARKVPEASTQLVPYSAPPARTSQHLPHVQRKLPALGSGSGSSQLQRQVIIYPPNSGSTISTNAQWKIGFENATSRRESPLQGWSLTGDTYLGVGEPGMHFDSREDAIAYAKKYGWAYRVEGELVKHRRNKSIGAYGWVELMRPAMKT